MRLFACFAFAVVFGGTAFGQVQAPPLLVGTPLAVDQVRIIPILGEDDSKVTGMLSLVDASKKGLVAIRDFVGNQVSFTNLAKQPILLLAGELIVGGHQDQILKQDYVIMPGQTTFAQVYCVESGRGMGSSSLFASTGVLVPDWIRRIAIEGATKVINDFTAQRLIWIEIDKINAASSQPSGPNSSIAKTLLEEGLSKDVEDMAAKYAAVEDTPRTIGLMVMINGKIYSTDLFSSHNNFEEFRPLLLRLYAVDAYLVGGNRRAQEVDLEGLQAYLNSVAVPPRQKIGSDRTTAWYRPATSAILGMESGLDKHPGYLHGVYFPN